MHLVGVVILLLLSPVFSEVVLADELEDLLTGFGGEDAPSVVPDQLDQLLEGFDEAHELEPDMVAAEGGLPDWLEFQGSISGQATAGFAHHKPEAGEPDYRGLSMLRARAELISDLSREAWQARLGVKGYYDAIYSLEGRSNYTDELLDEYETELELTEAWVQGSNGEGIDLKSGRQIVVWGRSDNIRITDILNPLDLRLPGMVDIRDLRLPVVMTKLDYYAGNYHISPLIVHEPRFDKTPVYNGEYFPSAGPLPTASEPSVSLDNQQYGMALNGIFSGWDFSVYGGSFFDNSAHIELNSNALPERKYSRLTMYGAAANLVMGNWLVKGEAAWFDGLEFVNSPHEDFSRLDLLAGFEYTGLSETVIAVELANRHLFEFDARPGDQPAGQKEDLVQSVIRLVRDFRHDTLHLTLLFSSFGAFGEDGALQRYQLEYELNDDTMVKTGLVFYQSGDYLPFQDMGDNDRLFFELEYRF
jgi:hypothetical protein